MFEIDPKFRHMGKGARRRRRHLGFARASLATLGLALVLGLFWRSFGDALLARFSPDGPVEQIVQTEEEFDIAPVVRGDTFTDIPGDPMIIPTDAAAESGASGKFMPGPSDLSPIRVGPAAPDRLALVSGDLYQRERQLVASLPTTREEFALFQAERSRERLMTAAADPTAGVADPGAGPALPVDPAARMSSSMAFIRDPALRMALWQDLILQVRLPTKITDLLSQNGFDRTAAERISARMVSQLGIKEELPQGALLALRYRMQAGSREAMQLSLYRSGDYVGSLAIGGSGQLVTSADPWTGGDLLAQSAAEETKTDAGEANLQYRLLDAIYSAAIRQGVPGPVIGEAIAMMARVYDLDAYAAEGDRLQLLFASKPGPGAAEAGQVLYIGVSGPSGSKQCYVIPRREGGYECYAPDARIAVASTERPALIAPVDGVLATRFSPPGKGGTGGGVVWRAAQGTKVVAVAAGEVIAVTPSAKKEPGSVTIRHDGGLESRYSGLDAIPATIEAKAKIAAGAGLGQIAAAPAGQDTGLSFQLLQSGTPVDPVPYLTGGGEILASDAVEMLISRIIHVESGGNATARNPLSTATGLGQFIESTWLRMMRSYRPDLVAVMDRGQLLDLRLDPAMSRQMVRHLAQENEAFLRVRGHQITPGNLYLAHFLGPMGASQALSADPSRSVGEVMGAGVVAANPFLSGYTIADLRNWAARKMNARAVSAAAALPEMAAVKLSPEAERFVAQMDALLADSPGSGG